MFLSKAPARSIVARRFGPTEDLASASDMSAALPASPHAVPAHDFIWRASAMTGCFVTGWARLRRGAADWLGLRAARGLRGLTVIAVIRSAGWMQGAIVPARRDLERRPPSAQAAAGGEGSIAHLPARRRTWPRPNG